MDERDREVEGEGNVESSGLDRQLTNYARAPQEELRAWTAGSL